MLCTVTDVNKYCKVMAESNDAVINDAHLFWPELFVELLKNKINIQLVTDYIKNATSNLCCSLNDLSLLLKYKKQQQQQQQ